MKIQNPKLVCWFLRRTNYTQYFFCVRDCYFSCSFILRFHVLHHLFQIFQILFFIRACIIVVLHKVSNKSEATCKPKIILKFFPICFKILFRYIKTFIWPFTVPVIHRYIGSSQLNDFLKSFCTSMVLDALRHNNAKQAPHISLSLLEAPFFFHIYLIILKLFVIRLMLLGASVASKHSFARISCSL